MRITLLILFTSLSIISFAQSEIRGYIIEIEDSKIFVDLNNQQVNVGDLLNILKSEGYFIHPVTKDTISREDEVVGESIITRVFDKYSSSKLISGNIEEIKVGLVVSLHSDIATEEERLRRVDYEVEKRRLEEEQRRRTEILNRTQNALEKANTTGTDTGKSEGVAYGEINQDVESGVVDAANYGEGSGTGTEGVSFDLAGRQARSLPKPSYDIQSEGIVVVKVTVDRNGNVTQAVPGVKGSTTLEEYFLRIAREAAMAAKFDRKPDSPVIQKGTITYHFIPR